MKYYMEADYCIQKKLLQPEMITQIIKMELSSILN